MFNALLKKRKGNKGFTLIELIVVIAILAILALLLVPRFLGFTDRAKDSADAATGKTIEKAVTTLLATGEIKSQGSAGTITYTESSSAWGVTGSCVTPSAIGSMMSELVGTSIDAQTGSGFTVNITSEGAITSVVVTP